ncbi:MAG: Inorganic pyrophosphatase [Erysipelotrichaceae bacterium]|nr:Inorganic pyrophosphatase [Erysipelotrichaceae bacterium]
MEFENNAYFWQKIDALVFSGTLNITREAGDCHPQYRNLIYPVRYGHLKDTFGASAEGVCAYVGSLKKNKVTAVVVAVDIIKKDLDSKILIDCTEEEEDAVLRFLNQTDYQKSVVIHRGKQVPNWALTDL